MVPEGKKGDLAAVIQGVAGYISHRLKCVIDDVADCDDLHHTAGRSHEYSACRSRTSERPLEYNGAIGVNRRDRELLLRYLSRILGKERRKGATHRRGVTGRRDLSDLTFTVNIHASWRLYSRFKGHGERDLTPVV